MRWRRIEVGNCGISELRDCKLANLAIQRFSKSTNFSNSANMPTTLRLWRLRTNTANYHLTLQKKSKYKFPYERYDIWHLSMDLSVEIYRLTASFPKEEKYGITSQIKRAANSVGANIAEGISRFSEKEKARFIEISFGSLMEVSHFLYLAKKLEIIGEEIHDRFRIKIMELSNKINAFHKRLRRG